MGFNAALKSKNIYMLYLLPFIVAAIAFVRLHFETEVLIPCQDHGLISFPFLTLYQDCLWLKEIGILVLLCLSFFIFFISDRYKFLSHITVLPAVIYALLSIGILCRYGVNSYLIAAVCVSYAVLRLQSAIKYTKSNAPVFGFGLFTCLAVLICPKLVMLVAWAILVLPFSGRATFKDFVALMIGFITALVFVGTYYFYTDQWMEVPQVFWDYLLEGQAFWMIMPDKLAAFIVLGVLVLVSLFHVMVNNSMAIVAQRRGMLSILSMLLFIGSSLFFIPFNCHGIMLVVAIPLSYLFTQYFISHRRRWMGNVLFLLLLAACVLLIL